MQVLTLDPKGFSQHAALLARMIDKESHFDALVGVRRGGSFVCDALCEHLPNDRYGARYDVELQRPSTKKKKGTISKILKSLPTFLLDIMRMAESKILAFHRRIKGNMPTPKVDIPEGLAAIIKTKEYPQILIIDDAIDSGETLFAIVETLKEVNPNVIISIAVMTVTTNTPRINADYALYRNRTLIRFPWSNDYKNR